MKIWAYLRKKQKIMRENVSEFEFGGQWTQELLNEQLNVCCNTLDISRPIAMEKHIEDMKKFSRTRFMASDFVETIAFDTFEIEVYE